MLLTYHFDSSLYFAYYQDVPRIRITNKCRVIDMTRLLT